MSIKLLDPKYTQEDFEVFQEILEGEGHRIATVPGAYWAKIIFKDENVEGKSGGTLQVLEGNILSDVIIAGCHQNPYEKEYGWYCIEI